MDACADLFLLLIRADSLCALQIGIGHNCSDERLRAPPPLIRKDVLNLFSIVREMSVWVYYEIRYVRIQYIIDMIQGERDSEK